MWHLLLWHDHLQDDIQTGLWKKVWRNWHWLLDQGKSQRWVQFSTTPLSHEKLSLHQCRKKNRPPHIIRPNESHWKGKILCRRFQAKDLPFWRSTQLVQLFQSWTNRARTQLRDRKLDYSHFHSLIWQCRVQFLKRFLKSEIKKINLTLCWWSSESPFKIL